MLVSKFKNLLMREDGVTTVEFAMISVIFISMLTATYAVGIYFLTWNRLQFGVEEAARYASVHDDATTSDLEEIVEQSLSIVSADVSALEVFVDQSSSGGITFRQVSATYDFSWNLPFLSEELNELSITAEARTAVN